jgi:3-phosphoshikimate 1-carboxyvinyltransferase
VIRKLGIVGVGLIGGSAALAARRAGFASEVVGLGRTQENLDTALSRGIVDIASRDPEILVDCDLVLLATPVRTLALNARQVVGQLRPDTVVTDGGSVKAEVVRDCEAILGPRFVGSHPIAGTEDSGAAAADEALFRDAVCVVTPSLHTDSAATALVRQFWEALGMRVISMDPESHDRALAVTSHLPHLLAFALAGVGSGERTALAELIGPSFRDMTRIAASSPEMWRDILLANASTLSDVAERFAEELEALRLAATRGDGAALESRIRRAGAWKRQLSGKPDTSATILPCKGPLQGTVRVPGDKSIGHRALLFGGIAKGVTRVRGLSPGADNASTVEVLRGLGVQVERNGDEALVHGGGFEGLRMPATTLDCGNSGTTMRLCAGLLAGRPFESRLDGDASLRSRPMARVQDPLAQLGAVIETDQGHAPLVVRGRKLKAADVTLAVASAQLKTSVLLAGLQAEGRTVVREPMRSRDHTERLLPHFGVLVEVAKDGSIAVQGPATLRAADVDVPGDPSAAAFWAVAASIIPGSEIHLPDVAMNPTRTGALDVLVAMGADVERTDKPAVGAEPVADLRIRHAPLHGVTVAGETMVRAIDEFPILAVAAAFADGETNFADGGELRLKESDRLATMAMGLQSMGADVHEQPDGLCVRGGGTLTGASVETFGDHRIAMAFAVAALGASGPVQIADADAIAVSDPRFLSMLETLRSEGS